MVTLKEIAARCDCSIATVSKALNGMHDISESRSQIIRETAVSMGYMPSTAVRTIKTNRSRTVGLLFFLSDESAWTREFFSKIASSIQKEMEGQGYDITPVTAGRSGVRGNYLGYCRYRGYDGVIVMSVGFQQEKLLELAMSEIPAVTIDCTIPRLSAVLSDNAQGMRELTRYAFQNGHRHIAFVHGEDTNITRSRVESFYKTCDELQISRGEVTTYQGVYHNPQSAAEATRALLAKKEKPTCIFYQDDYSAAGGMRTLLHAGVRVPQEMSVAGYDGTRLAQLFTPRLTTFQQDCIGIGRNAAQQLLRRMEKPRGFSAEHITLPGRILRGETVAPVRH